MSAMNTVHLTTRSIDEPARYLRGQRVLIRALVDLATGARITEPFKP